MSFPSNQPRSAGRSTNWLVVIVVAGLSLIALVAVYLVVQYLPSGSADDGEPSAAASGTETAGVTPDAKADFANATCEEFDLAEFETFSGGTAELATARSNAYIDSGTGTLYCEYTSDSGMTLALTVVADAAPDFAESTTDQSRRIWEGAPDLYTIEDFDSGGLAGYSNSYSTESQQVLDLHAGADRLLITIGLTAEFGGFEGTYALGIADIMAGQVLQRFQVYV